MDLEKSSRAALVCGSSTLTGLNLREVADDAGVNRGNIYHYFGSRRELLRAAIAQRFESMAKALTSRQDQHAPFVERRIRAFQARGTIQDS
jgi:AcrR family transcriptional regulator